MAGTSTAPARNRDNVINVTLGKDLLDRVREEAERQDRPVAYVIRKVVAAAFPEVRDGDGRS